MRQSNSKRDGRASSSSSFSLPGSASLCEAGEEMVASGPSEVGGYESWWGSGEGMSVEAASEEASVGTVDSKRVASAAGCLRRPYIRLTAGREGAASGVLPRISMAAVALSTRRSVKEGCRGAGAAAWTRKLWQSLGGHTERPRRHIPRTSRCDATRFWKPRGHAQLLSVCLSPENNASAYR